MSNLDVNSDSFRPLHQKSLTQRCVPYWLIWFGLYGTTSVSSLMQRKTGLFASTVDHVESVLVGFVFLNIPLQLLLLWTAIMLDEVCATRGSRICGRLVACLLNGLVAGHLLLTFQYL